jgi:hypothetical protein
MLQIVAILVSSSSLAVAVETDAGWTERAFPNTTAGAEQLFEFAAQAVGDPPDGIRITLGWLDDQDNMEHIIELLAKSEIAYGLASPEEIRGAAAASNLAENSARAVAQADITRFGFIYQRSTK